MCSVTIMVSILGPGGLVAREGARKVAMEEWAGRVRDGNRVCFVHSRDVDKRMKG